MVEMLIERACSMPWFDINAWIAGNCMTYTGVFIDLTVLEG